MPVYAERKSPARSPSTLRPIARSSRRSASGVTGPGPGSAEVRTRSRTSVMFLLTTRAVPPPGPFARCQVTSGPRVFARPSAERYGEKLRATCSRCRDDLARDGAELARASHDDEREVVGVEVERTGCSDRPAFELIGGVAEAVPLEGVVAREDRRAGELLEISRRVDVEGEERLVARERPARPFARRSFRLVEVAERV